MLLALLLRLPLQFWAEKLEREAFAFLVSNMGFAIELKLLLTPETKLVVPCLSRSYILQRHNVTNTPASRVCGI